MLWKEKKRGVIYGKPWRVSRDFCYLFFPPSLTSHSSPHNGPCSFRHPMPLLHDSTSSEDSAKHVTCFTNKDKLGVDFSAEFNYGLKTMPQNRKLNSKKFRRKCQATEELYRKHAKLQESPVFLRERRMLKLIMFEDKKIHFIVSGSENLPDICWLTASQCLSFRQSPASSLFAMLCLQQNIVSDSTPVQCWGQEEWSLPEAGHPGVCGLKEI